MKKHITFGLFALCMAMGFAQRHEIGIKGGYSIVGGDAKSVIRSFPDAGTNRRVQPTYIGLFYKRNLNPRQAIRVDGAYNIAFFDNLYTGTTKMSNDILEASALFEYSFFSINDELKKGETKLSPYVFAGLSGIMYDHPDLMTTVGQSGRGFLISTTYTGENIHKKKVTLGIPFGLGLKYKFGYNWSIFAEAMFRYTFTDNLDYSNLDKMNHTIRYNVSPTNRAAAETALQQYMDGHKGKGKDWLNSVTIGISYAFGRPPCYCK